MSNTAEKVEQQIGNGTKERPILFSAPMVRAILDGRKTVTRRVVKEAMNVSRMVPDHGAKRALTHIVQWWKNEPYTRHWHCPYGQPGDQLWVRETWRPDVDGDTSCTAYKADGAKIHIENTQAAACRWLDVRRPDEQWPNMQEPAWRPSIHQPRWASRIDLEITAVRVERLQEISVGDCCEEGAPIYDGDEGQTHAVQTWYRELWEQINGPGSWDLNPWVWVIEFKKI